MNHYMTPYKAGDRTRRAALVALREEAREAEKHDTELQEIRAIRRELNERSNLARELGSLESKVADARAERDRVASILADRQAMLDAVEGRLRFARGASASLAPDGGNPAHATEPSKAKRGMPAKIVATDETGALIEGGTL